MIVATQNNVVVLNESNLDQHVGHVAHYPSPLKTNDQVHIKITFNKIENNPDSSGSIGESIQVTVVSEFGAIATIILGISVFSIVIFSTKNKFLIILELAIK